MSVNKVLLVGRVGKDAELVGNETKVAKFSLATSEKYKDKQGEKVEQTEWHNVVLFGGMAENLCQYLTKGTQIFLEGKIQTQNYEGKDGNMRYQTQIVGQQIKFLSKANSEQTADNSETTDSEDNLPF